MRKPRAKRDPPEWTPPPSRTRPAMSREDAAQWLADQANHGLKMPAASGFRPEDILRSADFRESAYRRAARRLHPDTGGSHELFVKLQQAKEALER